MFIAGHLAGRLPTVSPRIAVMARAYGAVNMGGPCPRKQVGNWPKR